MHASQVLVHELGLDIHGTLHDLHEPVLCGPVVKVPEHLAIYAISESLPKIQSNYRKLM